MELTDRDHLLDNERVHPIARRKFKAVLQDVRAHGLPLFVWEVWRSRGRQRMYYAQGRSDERLRYAGFSQREIAAYRRAGYTADKPVITRLVNPLAHGHGRAMDCCWLVDGKPMWNVDSEWWQTYGRAAKAHGLIWGGDWNMRDLPHVEWRGEG